MKAGTEMFYSSLLLCAAVLLPLQVVAEIAHFDGSPEALPFEQYRNIVSTDDSPVQQSFIKSKDGAYVAAAIRKPKGDGPFPVMIMFHGAPGGRGLEQLVGWSRGDHGGPVWERFLQEGFVVVVADYRGGDWNAMNTPSEKLTTAIDDGIAVIDYVKALPYTNAAKINIYGVSLGGNLVMYLASRVSGLHTVVTGAPFPVWFLGGSLPEVITRGDFSKIEIDEAIADANITAVQVPVLILVGTADPILPVTTRLYEELDKRGKTVRMEVYEHGYHDFVLGPQGHARQDLPRGEILLQGALDALERTVTFVKSGHL